MPQKAPFIKFSPVGPKGLLNFLKREPQVVIRNVRKLWSFYLKQVMPTSLLGGHSQYTRFMIVGRPRTGSNLLRGSLMSHSQIVVFGDIFRKYNVIRWGIPYYPQTRTMLSLMQTDPVRFLETELFGKFPKQVAAVGMKTLYPHRYNQIWQPVQTYLESQKDVKIIHIKRKNLLKSHLSLKKVIQRKDRKNKWTNISGNGQDTDSLYLDYRECLKAFEEARKQEQEYDTFFKAHPKLEVFYEELSGDYENEMRRIQEFLGVTSEPTKPLTYKQSRQPLSKAISNYLELKEKFLGTPWEEFFED